MTSKYVLRFSKLAIHVPPDFISRGGLLTHRFVAFGMQILLRDRAILINP